MIINWVNTIYPYFLGISKNEIPTIERGLEKEYLLECFEVYYASKIYCF